MKAKDLATLLLKHPEFDVKFHYFDAENGGCFSWDNIDVTDIGYSDKVIILSGNPD